MLVTVSIPFLGKPVNMMHLLQCSPTIKGEIRDGIVPAVTDVAPITCVLNINP